MKKCLLLIVGFALSTIGLSSQGKPVIVVQAFTAATGVELPYDLKLMQPQVVAEFKVMLGKEFDIVSEAPATSPGTIYTLNAEITGWRPGNAAKRLVVGLGSGREAQNSVNGNEPSELGRKTLASRANRFTLVSLITWRRLCYAGGHADRRARP